MNGKSPTPEALTGSAAGAARWVQKVLNLFGLGALHPRSLANRMLARVISGRTVLAGPFAGMKYVHSSVGSVLLAKLLGTYELELQPIIEGICRQPASLLVDVGAAEGYYAVGLTRRCPTLRCIAFEAQADGRTLLKEMAEANGATPRIEVNGFCTRELLADALHAPEKTLLIMDVEGAEKELLDPVALPALAHCTILVELHPQFHPDIAEVIAARFAASHQQRIIHAQSRTVDELPFGAVARRLLGRWLILATTEYRPVRMSWLWMQPHLEQSPHGLAATDRTQSPP